MLFKEDKYNNRKFSFENTPTQIYTYTDLCNALVHLTELLRNDLTLGIEVELKETLIDGRKVRCKFVGEGLKEATLLRGYNEIHNIFCRKPEFKKRLEKIGIKEPDKNSFDFSIYLQFLYFFYVMIYFIFPNVKFMDLFDPKNWDIENTIECDTGNEIYEDFIIKNLKQNLKVKEMYESKMQSYDDAWSECCDTFFNYFNLHYYLYFNITEEGQFEEVCIKENVEIYKDYLSDRLKRLHERIDSQISTVSSRSLFDDFLDFDVTYTSTTLNKESKLNYELIDFESLIGINDELKELPLEEWDEIYLNEKEIEDLCQDDSFICLCMEKNHITNTIRKKYNTYEVFDIIMKIWNFEKYQMIYYPIGEGFTFLEEQEDQYVMTLTNCMIIAKTRIKLPIHFSYYSKRTILEDRSNAQKKTKHSIKESFKSVETENFDAKKSAFRDDLFRIACRMQRSILEKDSPKEFIYFELPMNIQLFELCDYAENYPYIEQKQQYYELAIQYMKEEMDLLLKEKGN